MAAKAAGAAPKAMRRVRRGGVKAVAAAKAAAKAATTTVAPREKRQRPELLPEMEDEDDDEEDDGGGRHIDDGAYSAPAAGERSRAAEDHDADARLEAALFGAVSEPAVDVLRRGKRRAVGTPAARRLRPPLLSEAPGSRSMGRPRTPPITHFPRSRRHRERGLGGRQRRRGRGTHAAPPPNR